MQKLPAYSRSAYLFTLRIQKVNDKKKVIAKFILFGVDDWWCYAAKNRME